METQTETVESKVAKIIKEKISEIEQLRIFIEWIGLHAEKLDRLPHFTLWENQIDFDCLPHDQVIAVIKEFGGKWEKFVHGDKINYRATISGMKVRCWRGEPPPNCKVVEVEEFVPEIPEVPAVPAIPAGVRKVRKLVCSGEKMTETQV